MSKIREMPEDFAAKAAVMAQYELKKHYRTGINQIVRWCREAGVTSKVCRRPVPDDFVEMAAVMCAKHLRLYYGAGADVIKRWIGETGVTPASYVVLKQERAEASLSKRARLPRHVATEMREKAYGIHDQAADVLRRNAWIVYRANDKGTADTKGKFWRVGNTVLTPDELLAKASRYEKRAA